MSLLPSVVTVGNCIRYRWPEESRATCSIAHAAMHTDTDIKRTIPNIIISTTKAWTDSENKRENPIARCESYSVKPVTLDEYPVIVH